MPIRRASLWKIVCLEAFLVLDAELQKQPVQSEEFLAAKSTG
jgi:hypothetical protein